MQMDRIFWKRLELVFITSYALVFYAVVIQKSIALSNDFVGRLKGLRVGWLGGRLNDLSDPQWSNFRGNLTVLTIVMAMFLTIAKTMRSLWNLTGKGMSSLWILLSLCYLLYLHGACILFILLIACANYFLVKMSHCSKYCIIILWSFNIVVMILNRIFEGYPFSLIGQNFAFLDNYRGSFRWHICFNFVVLRMISFGCDWHWALATTHFDHEKHMQQCNICSSGKICYLVLQERALMIDQYNFKMYLCYLIYAPLYIAGPVISFNAFATQMETPQKNYSPQQVLFYGLRWLFCFLLIEVFTHFFYYNSFAISGLWNPLSPFEIFIISYGVLNFMWLKFLLIWRYFRFLSLVGGIEAPENMPSCINNCYELGSFWKSWHASFNKWLVRYMYIPLGGYRRRLVNIWFVFTFVAIWHDLEWKLLSWAWLTCLFFIPELIVKSMSKSFKSEHSLGMFLQRESAAVGGAVTISCLMVANLVGYVIGPSGVNLLISRMAPLPIFVIFFSFYVGVKIMFHIRDAKQQRW